LLVSNALANNNNKDSSIYFSYAIAGYAFIFDWTNRSDNIHINKKRSYNTIFGYKRKIPLENSNFSFLFGIEFEMPHRIYNNAQPVLDSSAVTVFKTIPPSYKDNYLSTSYINIPVEFQYITNPFFKFINITIAAGITTGYLVRSKYSYTVNNNTFKETKVPNINPIKYGLTTRVGFDFNINRTFFKGRRNISIIGYYGLSSLFKMDKGPNIKPYSIGLLLGSYDFKKKN